RAHGDRKRSSIRSRPPPVSLPPPHHPCRTRRSARPRRRRPWSRPHPHHQRHPPAKPPIARRVQSDPLLSPSFDSTSPPENPRRDSVPPCRAPFDQDLQMPRASSALIHILNVVRCRAKGALGQGCGHELVEIAVEHA